MRIAKIAALGTAVVFASSAYSQDAQLNLRFSTYLPAAQPAMAAIEKEWITSINKASNGSIQIAFFPSEQLGNGADHYDMVRDGIVDFAFVTPGYQPGRFPVFGATELPFTVGDATKGALAINEWYAKYVGDEMPDVKYCLAVTHDPGGLHLVNKKVSLPQDLKGLKIRPASGTIANLFSSLGATNVQATAGEARELLTRGVVDGITFPWNSVFLLGFQDAVKYHLESSLYTTPSVVVMNSRRYDSMSEAQKSVIDAHCSAEWTETIVAPWTAWEIEGHAKMRALSGHEVYNLTPDEVAIWKEAASPLKQQWEAAVTAKGLDPKTVLDDLNQALAKHGGGA